MIWDGSRACLASNMQRVRLVHRYMKFSLPSSLGSHGSGPTGGKRANPSVQALFKPLFASLLLIFCWLKQVLKSAHRPHQKALPKGIGRGRGIMWARFFFVIYCSQYFKIEISGSC